MAVTSNLCTSIAIQSPVVTAWIILSLAASYAVAGLVVSLVVILPRLSTLDPAARDATFGFRLLILPGLLALWPVVLRILLRRTP